MAMFAHYLASSLGYHRHSLAAAVAVLSSPFPRSTLLKLSRFSTIIADKDKSTSYTEAENTCLVSEFLLNECGFSQSELLAILKARPSMVAMISAHTAEQAVQLLRDSGCTERQVRLAVTRNPSILCVNADRQLKPKIEFMKTLGLPAQDLGNAISNGSRLLSSSLEKTLRPNIQYLQNLFGSEVNVSIVFKSATFILIKRNGPEFWEKKLKHLTSFGLLEDDIKDLVRSLERRIKPRHKVLSALSAMQPSNRPPSLFTALALSERKFFINGSFFSNRLTL